MSNKVILKTIGLIFWKVNNKKRQGHDKPSTNLGTHWWKGAAPIFKKRDLKIRNKLILFSINILIIQKIIKTEAKACTKKYFNLDSDLSLFFFFNIKGKKESKLISIPNQAKNQLLEEITVTIENSIEIINKKKEGCIIIIKRELLPKWVMSPSAFSLSFK